MNDVSSLNFKCSVSLCDRWTVDSKSNSRICVYYDSKLHNVGTYSAE